VVGLTLITGGASSGKSTYAAQCAARDGKRVLYVATCEPHDAGMRAKIARHRAQRPAGWTTLEHSAHVADALVAGYDAAIVDCLTLLISQQLVKGVPEGDILHEVSALGTARPGYPLYVVTNEVGSGVIPASPLGRAFAELQGRANQCLAECAATVICMISGLPLQLKASPSSS
jgi:adenosyl cobinamide kinase/adenosyl cobinamide phosphate guanylyltransferase